MPRKPPATRLSITSLGPIKQASVLFGDLTVLVGPQASGKSILLQTLKLALDQRYIKTMLSLQGYDWKDDVDTFLDLYYGEGMRNLRTAGTAIRWQGKLLALGRLASLRKREFTSAIFYIPAHRALTLKQGWPRHFGDYSPGDPFVVRDFSESLRLLMEREILGDTLFPGVLSPTTEELLQDGIFGNYKLRIDRSTPQKRLVLRHGRERPLPFMVWSAGQREFSPLLLGLYPRLMGVKHDSRWIVLEEPEMGLHPRAITAVLFLVLELLHAGYKVCVSTHSPHVLDLLWALRVLKERSARPDHVLSLFRIPPDPRRRRLAADVLKKDVRVHAFDRRSGGVVEISRLDPSSKEHAEVTWGGLVDFSAHVSDVVADVVANS